MAISGFIGLPGSGKTSLLNFFAQRELKRIEKGKSCYKYVYTTFPCVNCFQLSFNDLGSYYIHDALILIDEVTLESDSRDWKKLSKETKEFIILHRHFNTDIIYTTQDPSRCEKTLRQNTIELYYVSMFFGWVHAERIYRVLCVNDFMADLVLGYRFREHFREFFTDLFSWFHVKKYWGSFDTNDKFGYDLKKPYKNVIWGSHRSVTPTRMRGVSDPDESKFDLIVSAN